MSIKITNITEKRPPLKRPAIISSKSTPSAPGIFSNKYTGHGLNISKSLNNNDSKYFFSNI